MYSTRVSTHCGGLENLSRCSRRRRRGRYIIDGEIPK